MVDLLGIRREILRNFEGRVLSGTNIFHSAMDTHSKYLGMRNVQKDHTLLKLQFLLLLYKTGS